MSEATRARQLSRDTYLALKGATRQLIEAAGGLRYAAAITGFPMSKLSEAQQTSVLERSLRLDHALELETATGEPCVTRELARLQGLILITPPRFDSDDVFVRHLGAVGKECGEAIAKVADAISSGGTIHGYEIRQGHLLNEVDEAMEALARLKVALVERLHTDLAPAPRRPRAAAKRGAPK
jgi:hypothetical protein